ncbi:MAG: DUF5668 domain-containing protein [Candidatus Dojkabacteria bacterium]
MQNNFTARVIVGLFFILLGLSLFLDQLGLNFFGFNIFNFWPLILIFFGFMLLVQRKFIGGLFLLLIGFAFLFSIVFHFSIFAVIWPLIIIFVGISILLRPDRYSELKGDYSSENTSTVSRDFINESVVFWGMDELVKSDNFEGGKLDCVFGGFKLDLRDAKISKDRARLEINCVFGGGELYLPRDLRVEVESTSVMGGVTNKAVSGKATDPIIRIKATAVFGGLEIKN